MKKVYFDEAGCNQRRLDLARIRAWLAANGYEAVVAPRKVDEIDRFFADLAVPFAPATNGGAAATAIAIAPNVPPETVRWRMSEAFRTFRKAGVAAYCSCP